MQGIPAQSLLSALLQRDYVKTLTLTEPWCSLVAHGTKRMETRSWRTDYRGPLAMHAAKALPKNLNELCQQPAFREALHRDHWREQAWQFPTGHILAVVLLDEVLPAEQVRPSAREQTFGDFSRGRYAWLFSAVYRLVTPVPARGVLGLWDWQPPTSFWREIQAAFEKERQVAHG